MKDQMLLMVEHQHEYRFHPLLIYLYTLMPEHLIARNIYFHHLIILQSQLLSFHLNHILYHLIDNNEFEFQMPLLLHMNNMHLIHKHGDPDWCTVKLSCYCLHFTQFLCPGAAMVTISCASIWKVLCIHRHVCLHSKYICKQLHTPINHLTIFYFQCSK